MARRLKLVAAFFAVYLFGIATPYLVQRPIAALGRSIGGREEFSRKTADGVLDAMVIQINPGASEVTSITTFWFQEGRKWTPIGPTPQLFTLPKATLSRSIGKGHTS